MRQLKWRLFFVQNFALWIFGPSAFDGCVSCFRILFDSRGLSLSFPSLSSTGVRWWGEGLVNAREIRENNENWLTCHKSNICLKRSRKRWQTLERIWKERKIRYRGLALVRGGRGPRGTCRVEEKGLTPAGLGKKGRTFKPDRNPRIFYIIELNSRGQQVFKICRNRGKLCYCA